jgi:hypothetical protein
MVCYRSFVLLAIGAQIGIRLKFQLCKVDWEVRMIVSGSNNLSDDSDDDVENGEVDTYRRKYQLLLERCEVLQQVKFSFICSWQFMDLRRNVYLCNKMSGYIE